MGKKLFRSWLVIILSAFVLLATGCGSEKQQKAEDSASEKVETTVTQQQDVAADQNTEPGTAVISQEQETEVKDQNQVQDQTQPKNPSQEKQGKSAEAPKAPAPTVNAKQGSYFTIEGSGVSKPVQFTLADLQAMKEVVVDDDYFALNNYGTKQYFHFKGVSLWYLLNKAGVKSSAQKVTFIAEDGYSATYTIAEAKRQDYIDEQNPDKKYKMIIAWEENGKAYDANQYPFRFVVGQKAPGDINKANWVEKIKTIRVD